MTKGKKEKRSANPLAAYGEAFMRMFDDYDETQQQPSEEPSSSNEQQAAGSDASSDSGTEASSDAEEVGDEDGQPGPGPSSLEQYLYSGRKGGSTLALGNGAAAGTAHLGKRSTAVDMQQRLLEKRMRKQFMSPKAQNIFADAPKPSLTVDDIDSDDDLGGLTKEEFAAVQREVELLGASQLDKKAHKAWKAGMLARLGAQAEAGPRTAAKIGLGMAKKQRVRQAKALDEAIQTGMVKRKGLGKKKKAERAANRDLGLQELSGFKNGMLRISKPKVAKTEAGTRIPSNFGGVSKPKVKGGKNGKKKGGKGGKKGGKRR